VGVEPLPPAIPLPNVGHVVQDIQTNQPIRGILSRLDLWVGADEAVFHNLKTPPVTPQDARKVGNVAQVLCHRFGILPDALSAKVNLLHLEGSIRKQVDRYVNFHIESPFMLFPGNGTQGRHFRIVSVARNRIQEQG
jgi:hypothetical protein